MVKGKTGIEPAKQLLSFGGKALVDGTTLLDYGVQKDCTINLVVAVTGGQEMLT
jgi:hypothetical protein